MPHARSGARKVDPDRAGAGELVPRPGRRRGEIESHRPGRADGADAPEDTRWQLRLLDRRLGRLSGEPPAPAVAHRPGSGCQSRRHRRRHPCFLRQRPASDFDDPDSPVASEIVGTSISSFGPPYEAVAKYLRDNPHLRFFDSRKRGYVSVEVEAEQMTARMQVVSDATDPKASTSTSRPRRRKRPAGRRGGVRLS